jgi:hypothetical protein
MDLVMLVMDAMSQVKSGVLMQQTTFQRILQAIMLLGLLTTLMI